MPHLDEKSIMAELIAIRDGRCRSRAVAEDRDGTGSYYTIELRGSRSDKHVRDSIRNMDARTRDSTERTTKVEVSA